MGPTLKCGPAVHGAWVHKGGPQAGMGDEPKRPKYSIITRSVLQGGSWCECHTYYTLSRIATNAWCVSACTCVCVTVFRFLPAVVGMDHISSTPHLCMDGILWHASEVSQRTQMLHIVTSYISSSTHRCRTATTRSGPGQLRPACLPSLLAHTTEMTDASILTPAALCCITAGPPAHALEADSQVVDVDDSVRVLRPQHPLPLL